MYSSHISTGDDFSLVCIPRTGVFLFSSDDLSYSQAQISCQKMNASIAHIISEQRTNELAKYILQNTPTFVGLSNRDHENVWKNEFDEPLACFKYRAWAVGEPSHWKGCVGLFQPSESKSGPVWKVLSCNSTLPFICEIPPM
ncbi:lithostathine isoform X2 [Colletes latitarsis]|uniref:lithostathine isoform X2 n=1 Tax=Colletes latitarsis TaxID=2605962 RepID=UPI0040350722